MIDSFPTNARVSLCGGTHLAGKLDTDPGQYVWQLGAA